ENIIGVGGTSAGAINSVLLALGYTHAEMKEVLWGLDFNKFLDDEWGFLRDANRLVNEFGWYKGDYFRDWIAKLIQQKTGNSESTFSDIEIMKDEKGFKSLFLIGTNISTSFSEVFSAIHTPNICVADALRISMSIPLFFTAKRSLRGDVYVDGGLLRNYPIKLFDFKGFIEDPSVNGVDKEYYEKLNAQDSQLRIFNKETLGFRLDTRDEIESFRDHKELPTRKINDFFDYTSALINTILEAQQNRHLHSDDWKRTVYVDSLNIGTTDFDLSDTQKKELIQSGKEGALHYFDWLDTESPE
ncbi:patatin-like phospholipase family protein, partial [Vibrio tubiashii]|uniref:patatin-like phospholipase family protein n=1 Tax=Vibrio tubiashii TaxID=29498 RepID=UPI001EFC611E